MKKNIHRSFLQVFKSKAVLAVSAGLVAVSCGTQMGGYSETDGVYYDPNRDTLPEDYTLGLALFVGVLLWVVSGIRSASAISDREGLRMAERAVRQAAVSIYAMEGAYPATYEELKAESGIAVDEEKYAVFYDIFASNLMPEITVVPKGAEQ